MFMIIYVQYLLIFSSFIELTHSQYVSFQRNPAKSTLCDNSSNTSLVEHFFNLIFSEFHESRPECVCVQMCVDQPTYCYPNGCLKLSEKKEQNEHGYQPTHVPTHILPVQNDKTKPMSFLVHDQSEFMKNFMEANYVVEPKKAVTDRAVVNVFRPDPYKDKYKTIYKFKKMPKVHLRYNLREQVKNNMKSDGWKQDSIDVSKTRWPVNKHVHVNENKQFFINAHKKSDLVEKVNADFLPPLPKSESFPLKYESKFFKRDLTKKKNLGNNVATSSDEAEISVDKSSFSLEHLIENLIENNFGPLTNDTNLDLNMQNENSTIVINETTNVVSMNFTNENVDQNKYFDDTNTEESYKNVYNEMIAKLSKIIEKQNNCSIEMIEEFTGKHFGKNTDLTISESISVDNTTVGKTRISSAEKLETIIVEKEIPSETTSMPVPTDKAETEVTKKSRQIISKKLQKSKVNKK